MAVQWAEVVFVVAPDCETDFHKNFVSFLFVLDFETLTKRYLNSLINEKGIKALLFTVVHFCDGFSLL